MFFSTNSFNLAAAEEQRTEEGKERKAAMMTGAESLPMEWFLIKSDLSGCQPFVGMRGLGMRA